MNAQDGLQDIKKGLIGIIILLRGISILILTTIKNVAEWIQKHTEIGWQQKSTHKKH